MQMAYLLFFHLLIHPSFLSYIHLSIYRPIHLFFNVTTANGFLLLFFQPCTREPWYRNGFHRTHHATDELVQTCWIVTHSTKSRCKDWSTRERKQWIMNYQERNNVQLTTCHRLLCDATVTQSTSHDAKTQLSEICGA